MKFVKKQQSVLGISNICLSLYKGKRDLEFFS